MAASTILYDLFALYGDGECVGGVLSSESVKEGLKRPVALGTYVGGVARQEGVDAWGRCSEGVRAIVDTFTVE